MNIVGALLDMSKTSSNGVTRRGRARAGVAASAEGYFLYARRGGASLRSTILRGPQVAGEIPVVAPSGEAGRDH